MIENRDRDEDDRKHREMDEDDKKHIDTDENGRQHKRQWKNIHK